MANSKASKQEIKFPPLLNIADDKLHIDSSFQNFEENNAPFLNSMIQPTYIKDTGFEKVYDTKGNGYYINDLGHLVDDNGKINVVVDNAHFESTEMSGMDNVIAYDLSGGIEAKITKVGSNLILYFNGATYTLTYTTKIIASRVRIIDGYAYFVIYSDNGSSNEYIGIHRLASNGAYATIYSNFAAWRKQKLSQGGVGISMALADVRNVSPLISIAKSNSYIVFSLVSKSGEVVNSNDLVWETLVFDGSHVMQIGSDLIPGYESASYTPSCSDRLTYTYNISSVNKEYKTVLLNSTTVYYYSSSATNINQLSIADGIPAAAVDSSMRIGTQTLETNAIDNPTKTYGTFTIYSVPVYNKTITFNVRGTSNNRYAINVACALDNPNNRAYWNALPGTLLEAYNGFVYSRSNSSGTVGSAMTGFTYKWVGNQPEPRPYPLTYRDDGNRYESAVYCYRGVNGLQQLYVKGILDSEWNSMANITANYQESPYAVKTWCYFPCVISDDGRWYSPFRFDVSTITEAGNISKWNTSIVKGYIEVDSATGLAINGSYYSFSAQSSHTTTDTPIVRSNSYLFGQNFFASTIKYCNQDSTNCNSLAGGTPESAGSVFIEYAFSSDGGQRYGPGTSRDTSYNYFAKAAYNDPTLGGAAEDALVYTVGGHRVPIPNSNFNILYNIYNGGYGYTQGISWSSSANAMGTLVTPWQSVQENTYIAADGNKCVYKDKSGKWIKIEVKQKPIIKAILDNRCIIINTTSYYNMIDSENGKLYHYATDYNGRYQFGNSTSKSFPGTLKTSINGYTAYSYIRYTGDAVNPMYKVMPREIVTSMITPIQARYRCNADVGSTVNAQVPDVNAQSVDVFFSDQNSTACEYRKSLINNFEFCKNELLGLYYPGSTSSAVSLTPSIFAEYVNGAGNNDLVVEGFDAYTMTYFENKPVLVYSASTQVSSLYDKNSHFFVIQGQYYGIVNHKLYAMLYSNGSISQMDAIIDLGDMEFIGNNPLIAFFYDPATRVIRSFTGDANLELLYGATKITKYNNSWYDETTQSIYASTDAGLLVFGSRNTYLHRDWKNVTNCQFTTDGVTHITNDNRTYDLVYYKTSGYAVKPTEIETSFYGVGSTETTSIDRWSISLYNLEGDHPDSWIKVGVRSINDITVKSEEKTFKITPDMYDKWSNSVLINFNPKLIKGQGLKLYIETPLTIQRIVAHVMDDGNSVLTKRNV